MFIMVDHQHYFHDQTLQTKLRQSTNRLLKPLLRIRVIKVTHYKTLFTTSMRAKNRGFGQAGEFRHGVADSQSLDGRPW